MRNENRKTSTHSHTESYIWTRIKEWMHLRQNGGGSSGKRENRAPEQWMKSEGEKLQWTFAMHRTHRHRHSPTYCGCVCVCGMKFIVHRKIGLSKNQADKVICRKVSWELETKATTKKPNGSTVLNLSYHAPHPHFEELRAQAANIVKTRYFFCSLFLLKAAWSVAVFR